MAGKPKVAAPFDVSKQDAEITAMVDELGAIQMRQKAIQSEQKRYDFIRTALLDHLGDFIATAGREIHGKKFICTVSPRRFETRVLVKKLLKSIGMVKLLEICTISQKAIEQILPGAAVTQFLTSEQTGPRVVSAAPIPDSPLR